MRSWTAPQLQTFLEAARSHRLFPAFWLSRLSVNRALVSVAYELHESRGKTPTSLRSINLDSATIAMLKVWRERQTAELGRPVLDRHHVVAPPDGQRIRPDRFSQCFRSIVDGLDVPRIRLHDLRHPHATFLLKEHTPIKVVSERLGHASPAFTMATYQHVLPGMQADAARVFGQLLSSTGFYPVEDELDAVLVLQQ